MSVDWEERARDASSCESAEGLLDGILAALIASNERAARIEEMLERIETDVNEIRHNP